MKLFFTKILSLFFVSIVLFSSTTFTITEHYCCNELVDASILDSAESCGMDNMETSPKNCTIGDDDCCTINTYTKQGSDDFKQVVFNLETDQVVFVASFVYSYLNLFKGYEEKAIPFPDYYSPLISKDIIVLHETFLI